MLSGSRSIQTTHHLSAMAEQARTFKSFEEWRRGQEPLIVGEGYMFELIRRGYVAVGDFSPDVVLHNPRQVELLHEEFVHAGSDVVLSYTYYANRSMMELRDRGHLLRDTNLKAHAVAKAVAARAGALFAGGLCNTNVMRSDSKAEEEIRAMFEEQVTWAKESGVEFMIAETLNSFLEAKMAIETCRRHGLPVVVSFNLYRSDACLLEGMTAVEGCRMAEEAGAAVVGLNCGRDPLMLVPFLPELRAACRGPIAAVPACYRTTETEPSFLNASDPRSGRQLYPKDIIAAQCCPSDVEEFALACRANGVRYAGLCCGNSGCLTRTLAEGFGRCPPSTRYSAQAEKSLKQLWS